MACETYVHPELLRNFEFGFRVWFASLERAHFPKTSSTWQTAGIHQDRACSPALLKGTSGGWSLPRRQRYWSEPAFVNDLRSKEVLSLTTWNLGIRWKHALKSVSSYLPSIPFDSSIMRLIGRLMVAALLASSATVHGILPRRKK